MRPWLCGFRAVQSRQSHLGSVQGRFTQDTRVGSSESRRTIQQTLSGTREDCHGSEERLRQSCVRPRGSLGWQTHGKADVGSGPTVRAVGSQVELDPRLTVARPIRRIAAKRDPLGGLGERSHLISRSSINGAISGWIRRKHPPRTRRHARPPRGRQAQPRPRRRAPVSSCTS